MMSAIIAETYGSVKRRFLVFQLGERVYALPAETVAEVIRIPATARVPQAPRALIGVANLRAPASLAQHSSRRSRRLD